MNTSKVGGIFNSFLMAAALLAGCSRQPQQGAGGSNTPANTASVAIQPQVSVGPVHSGMTIHDVTAVLGRPDHTSNLELVYTNLGIHVVPGDGNLVHIVGVSSPFAGRTKEGIGVGDSREAVIQAYGQPTDAVPLKPGYEVIKYKQLELNFQLHDGKVNLIATVFPG
jgi:hypothetical protein